MRRIVTLPAALAVSLVLAASGILPIADRFTTQVASAQTETTPFSLSLANYCQDDLTRLPPDHPWTCETRLTSQETSRTIIIAAGLDVLADSLKGLKLMVIESGPGFTCTMSGGAPVCSTVGTVTIAPGAYAIVFTKSGLTAPAFVGFSSMLLSRLGPPYSVSCCTADGGDVGWD
jgi:hypothetical protein